MLTMDNYIKLYTKCEDCARKKRLDIDTRGHDAMDIGEVNGQEGTNNENTFDWNQNGYVDEEGNWWSSEEWDNWYAATPGYGHTEEYINVVNKGKGKGKGSICYKCGATGHITRDCRSKGTCKG